jgi:hypothetical protein
MTVIVARRNAMEPEAKEPSLDDDPFAVGQITERLPAWEQWEDGIEPADDERGDRAA